MSEYILEMKNISKHFPGVKALDCVDLQINKGEVHALVGENGAGKSTLMKVLNGVHQMDTGEIFIDGEKVEIKDTNVAQGLGLGIIYQEFNLIPTLSVAENLFVGRLMTGKTGLVNWKEIKETAKSLLNELDFNIDIKKSIDELTVAEMQMVEIAKVIAQHAKIIVMDEPSATLTEKELYKLFHIINTIKKEGVTIIYISHRLEEIFEICDNVSVLRDGKMIDTVAVKDTNRKELIEKMVGRAVENEFPQRTCKPGEVILEVKNLSIKGDTRLKNLSFELRKGEVLGIGGLVGAGRTEMLRGVYGADAIGTGEIVLKGEKVKIGTPTKAKKLRLGLVPEDRKRQGLFLDYEVCKNITVANLGGVTNGLVVSGKRELDVTKEYIEKIKIKTPNAKQKIQFLSGGNQQKVVLSKWLFADTDVLILDEPTRGIDVGAKYEIYLLINQLIAQGKSIVLISSEMPELVAMSDRIIVMHEGKITGELGKEDITCEKVMELAIL